MRRTGVRFGRLGGAIAATMVAANLVAQAAGGEAPQRPDPVPAIHSVRHGETLWGIARRLVGPEGDPRPMVADLRQLNALGGEPLQPGTRLALPSD